jgi:hypothetical protein
MKATSTSKKDTTTKSTRKKRSIKRKDGTLTLAAQRKRLHTLLDEVWRHYVCTLWEGKCYCGKEAGSYAHHFFNKGSHPSVRWDKCNGVLTSFGCHIPKIHHRGDTEDARQALIEKLGSEKVFEGLRERAHTPVKLSIEDMEDMLMDLKLASRCLEMIKEKGKPSTESLPRKSYLERLETGPANPQ